MVPLLKEVREGYTVDIELKGTHATTHALHLGLHFNIPGNVSDTEEGIQDSLIFFFCKLYCTSYQVHQVMILHLNAQVEMVIILQWNAPFLVVK